MRSAAADHSGGAKNEEEEFAAPLSLSEESFENAVPVDVSSFDVGEDAAANDASDGDSRDGSELKSPAPPPLEQLLAKIPATTQRTLDELFRAKITLVRRIRPEQLR